MRAWMLLVGFIVGTCVGTTAGTVPTAAVNYEKVKGTVDKTLKEIRADLITVAKNYPQLAKIEDAKLTEGIVAEMTYASLTYQKDARWIAPRTLAEHFIGGAYEIANNGCRIEIQFKVYNENSDPRARKNPASANPGAHFLANPLDVPYGVKFTVNAEDTEPGREFQKQISQLINKHLTALHTTLGSRPIDYSTLFTDQSAQ